MGEYRSCPLQSCGILRPIEYGDVLLFFCTKCYGLWLEGDQLVKLSTSQAPILINTELLSKYTTSDQNQRKTTCPNGHGNMKITQFPTSRPLVLDWCQDCFGIWFERGEMDRIAKVASNTKRSIQNDIEVTYHTAIETEILKYQDGTEPPAASQFYQWLTGVAIEVYSPVERAPIVTWTLIGINFLVFMLQFISISYNTDTKLFFQTWGMTPQKIMHGDMLWTLFSSMFLHAGIVHLLGNMYFLWIAGDNVEDRLGHWRFLLLYVMSGIIAAFLHIATVSGWSVPMVGASGAISGLLGAYSRFFPKRKFFVRFFYFLWFNWLFRVPAYVYFGFWFFLQAIYAMLQIPGIAFSAHIGGFIAGLAIAHWYMRRPCFVPSK